MKENIDYGYEWLNGPYETVDGIRRELFETLEGKQKVTQVFEIFSKIRNDENRLINITENGELEHVLVALAKVMNMKIYEEYSSDYDNDILQKISYFRTEFSNRNIIELDLSTIEGFSQLLDIYATVAKQGLMRAKLHAKLMMGLTEEEVDEIYEENLLLEGFLEKEKGNKEVTAAYAQELYNIFIDTGGVDFWIGKSRESLMTLGIEEPKEQDIMDLAEMAFNGYLKDIFGIEVPPLHFVGINKESQEEMIKTELGLSVLYTYILKNQLPS